MKKFFGIHLALAMIFIFACALTGKATAANTSKDIGTYKVVDHAVAVTDVETGYTQRVENTGAAPITQRVRGLMGHFGSGQVYTGTCRFLYAKMVGATAGDTVGIYDTTSNLYPIKSIEFELRISANNGTDWVDGKGAPFENGIRLLATSSTLMTSVLWDY